MPQTPNPIEARDNRIRELVNRATMPQALVIGGSADEGDSVIVGTVNDDDQIITPGVGVFGVTKFGPPFLFGE